MVDMKPRATPVRERQYPIPQEACLGIQCLHGTKILIVSPSSLLHTLLLPVKKPGGNDCLHNQDLCTINNTMITIHPVVSNPYILLSLLLSYASWFTSLDLKDGFFCLAVMSQPALLCL